MIYYFSGTGNSFDAARHLTAADEEMFDMASFPLEGSVECSLADGEALGFVFPVYYAGIPSIVREFVSRLNLKVKAEYVYAVITCGGNIYGAGEMFGKELEKNGIHLDAVYSVRMPENYVIMFNIEEEGKRNEILASAKEKLKNISGKIESRETVPWSKSVFSRIMTRLIYPSYERVRKTDKFWVDDQCIGCATCVNRCPAKAMDMKDGHPVWIKDKCIHCMSCIRCGAVQYGKSTVGKKRYTNPVLKSCH